MFGGLDRNRFSLAKKKQNVHHFLPNIAGSGSPQQQQPLGPHLLRSSRRKTQDEADSGNVSELRSQYDKQPPPQDNLKQEEEEPTERTEDLTEENSTKEDFPEDESPRDNNNNNNEPPEETNGKSNVKLLSSTSFEKQEEPPEAPTSSPLTSMVHAMDPALLDEPQEELDNNNNNNKKEEELDNDDNKKEEESSSKQMKRDDDASPLLSSASILSSSAIAAAGEGNSPTSVLEPTQVEDDDEFQDELPCNSQLLASNSSFRSHRDRLAYKLRKGRKGMTHEERKQSKTYLPTRLSVTTTDPTLAVVKILLVDPFLKLFEVVEVDTDPETTVGDVLAKARVAATDTALSDQTYVSLCNQEQELAAPLPVRLLTDDVQVLAAVPEGYTAGEIRYIQTMLVNNPRMKRWLQQQDPFTPKNNSQRNSSSRSPRRNTQI